MVKGKEIIIFVYWMKENQERKSFANTENMTTGRLAQILWRTSISMKGQMCIFILSFLGTIKCFVEYFVKHSLSIFV